MSARALIYLLFFISGAVGLIYEVLWLRMLILIFGSTQFAVSTILTAFMAGLALGSWWFGRSIDRRGDPVAIYGKLELGIGLYGLLVPFLFEALVPIYRMIWSSFTPDFFTFSLLRFMLVVVVLILPTAMMGATLPVLSRFVARQEDSIGFSVGSLYALNTLGAVVGTSLTGFILIPAWGTRTTMYIAAGLNLAIGLAALALSRSKSGSMGIASQEPQRATARSESAGDSAIPPEAKILLFVLAGSGFVAMVYEVAWTRVLGLIIGSSVYAFTIMLTTFLIGLAGGAAIASKLADRLRGRFAVEGVIILLTGTAVAAFGTMVLFNELPLWFAQVYWDVRGSNAQIFALKFGIAFVVMLPATLLMGGLFPLVLRVCAPHVEKLGRSVGMVYSSNTLGTIFGSFLAGFFLIPAIGIQGSLMLAITLDLLLAGILVSGVGRRLRDITGWSKATRIAGVTALAALGTGLWVFRPAWDTLIMNSGVYQYADDLEEKNLTPEGFREFMAGDVDLRFYKEGMTTSVMVMQERSTKVLLMAVNGKIDASSAGDLPTQVLSGHLPVLLADDPDDVMVIGYASGITVGAAAQHPVTKVTAVELESAILEASHWFDEFNHRPLDDPKVEVIRNDGRNFLLVSPRQYDVIISEPSNPWMTVAANLFTKEFFELGRDRLKQGGVFAQWLQLYGMSPEDLRVLMRTFAGVFPHVLVFNTIEDADLILVGSSRPLEIDLDRLKSRMSDLSVSVDLRRVGVRTPEDLLSYLIFGSREIAAFTGEGPVNTDDNALIEFHAPKSLHYETRGANTTELRAVTVDPSTYVKGLDDPELRRRHAVALADAFVRRRMWQRARGALSAVPGLGQTEEGARILGLIGARGAR